MWPWIMIAIFIDIIAGGIYTIKKPPKQLKSTWTVIYILLWFLFILLDYQLDKQRRESYERLKRAGIGNTIPNECTITPPPSLKCTTCNRSYCPNRL